jgi:chromosome segregation ATPase
MKEGKCVMGEMRKDREGALPNDVDGLIEHYRHEVRKGQEAYDQLLKELNMLRGTKQIVERLSGENQKMKKRAQEAEGELTIIKGIGNTSPEMRALQARVKELDNSLSIALETNDKFQRQNVAMRKRAEEVEEDNKRLSQQISDYIRKHEDSFRKAGL